MWAYLETREDANHHPLREGRRSVLVTQINPKVHV